jgi:DNA-binding response OmpR family regulator
MNGSILVVEDDPDIAALISLYLQPRGFLIRNAGDGKAALKALDSESWDMVLLDINLPDTDGFSLLATIRRTRSVPVIMITARREDADAVRGLEAGADEYVTKPFSPRVLVARVEAILRRSRREHGIISLGADVTVDMETAQVFREGARVPVAPREFALLRYLLERNGKPAAPEEIYHAVWGNDYGDLTSVAVHIQRLRRKLETNPRKPRFIVTQRGFGYAIARGGEGE